MPSLNSNLSYRPETLNSGQNRRFFKPCYILILQMTLEQKLGHLFYATPSFGHHFVPIGEFKQELQSGNTQFG